MSPPLQRMLEDWLKEFGTAYVDAQMGEEADRLQLQLREEYAQKIDQLYGNRR